VEYLNCSIVELTCSCEVMMASEPVDRDNGRNEAWSTAATPTLTSAYLMASLTSTHRRRRQRRRRPETVLRDRKMFYGDIAGSVMAEEVAAHDGANQAQRNGIVSSCEVYHLRRRPARPLAMTCTLSSTLRSNLSGRQIRRAYIARNRNRVDRAWQPNFSY